MVKRNTHVAKLHSGYLFPEINRRKKIFLEKNSNARLISLGIGNTTEPLPNYIVSHLANTSLALGTDEGYSGYGPEEGLYELRQAIAKNFYKDLFSPEEILISDGTNSDIGRLQILFGGTTSLAVQDPSYPVYVDTGVILGQTSNFDNSSKKYLGIHYMPCHPDNHFFPDLSEMKPTDLIYFCSPNNPTGECATFDQLNQLIQYAKKHHSIIIFDTAYASFIQDSNLPRSIYELPGAKEVAIELGSFSKMAGFTGVRLAWSVVPKELQFEDGHSVLNDWNRVHCTFFNGASNISQAGGMAALHDIGQKNLKNIVQFYMNNASLLYKVFEENGFEIYGGKNAPYVWVKFPTLTSWQAFDLLLEKAHIVTAPGGSFGPAGEGFLRLSAFGKRNEIEEAVSRLSTLLKKEKL